MAAATGMSVAVVGAGRATPASWMFLGVVTRGEKTTGVSGGAEEAVLVVLPLVVVVLVVVVLVVVVLSLVVVVVVVFAPLRQLWSSRQPGMCSSKKSRSSEEQVTRLCPLRALFQVLRFTASLYSCSREGSFRLLT
jgi:hypothetical protein